MYEEGRIVGVLTAEPTPKKPKRRLTKNKKSAPKMKLARVEFDSEESEEEISFSLPKSFKYKDRYYFINV